MQMEGKRMWSGGKERVGGGGRGKKGMNEIERERNGRKGRKGIEVEGKRRWA